MNTVIACGFCPPDPMFAPRKPGPICLFCFGTGCESTYWGTVVHGNWGSIKVDGEHRDPVADCPGGVFYGGSAHKACRCRSARHREARGQ